VTFFDNPEEYRSKETVAKLNELIKKSRDTAVLALERDQKMGLQDEWLIKVSQVPVVDIADEITSDAPSSTCDTGHQEERGAVSHDRRRI
jgi:flagellar motor component MotA